MQDFAGAEGFFDVLFLSADWEVSRWCDGKWLMRDRKVLTLDEEVIVKEAQKHAEAIYKRAGIVLPDRFPTIR